MKRQLSYGSTAKALHWVIVALLIAQYAIGWFMPDIHRGMTPGAAMTFHISIGISIFSIILVRLIWRITHPVAPESALPAWQRVTSEWVHWLLYVMVIATSLSGWLFASQRGWSIWMFYAVPLPMLAREGSVIARNLGGLHQTLEWSLLGLIAIHVAAALAHVFIYRDRVMQRMLMTD